MQTWSNGTQHPLERSARYWLDIGLDSAPMHANTRSVICACTAWLQGLQKALNNASHPCRGCVCLHISAETGMSMNSSMLFTTKNWNWSWPGNQEPPKIFWVLLPTAFRQHMERNPLRKEQGLTGQSSWLGSSGCRDMNCWLVVLQCWKVHQWAGASWRK